MEHTFHNILFSFYYFSIFSDLGILNQKREPSPSLDSTPITPPSLSTMTRQMASPSPVPLIQFDEALKHFIYLVSRNSDTCIFYIKVYFIFGFFNPVSHFDRTFRGEFQSIICKVDDNL